MNPPNARQTPKNSVVTNRIWSLVAAISLLISTQLSFANGPLNTVVFSTDTSSTALDVHNKDFRQTTQNLINGAGPFSSLANRPFLANFSIDGAKDLLQLSSNSSGTLLTLKDLRSGDTQIFTGANRQEAEAKLNEFVQETMNRVFIGFQRSLNSDSIIGVTDGNPLAATAFFSSDAFNQFGFIPTVPQANKVAAGNFEIGVEVGGGSYSANDTSGSYADIDVNVGLRLTDWLAAVLSVPVEYRDVNGTGTYIAGLNLGIPITLIHHAPTMDGLVWQITPWANVGGGINQSILSGGGIYGGGGTSSLAYQIGALTFTLANQFSHFNGFPFTYGKIKYDTPVNQWLVQNGLLADYRLSRFCFVNAGIIYTDFLDTAAVHDYFTARAGLGFRWGPYGSSDVQISYVGDFGNSNYQDNGLELILRLRF